ncbi:MAG: trypsin-like peptidase domain-containing protein [Clostridia bacterium]|nr:trypsin-like peptidase domain-containing protein [Clostridia bacterium]
MKKTLSLLLALLMALGVLSALSESFASDYAAMNEAAASVLVMTLYDEEDKEIGKASGFMAFDGRHAVTTWLAVSTAARIEIVTDEGQKLGAFKLLGCDSDCNIAILAFDEDTNLKPLALLEEGNARRAAACVSIAGQNGVNAINTGNIATTFSVQGLDLIQFTAPISDGASGGALLDENGLVAGVTMFGLSGEIGYTVVQNMNFALSVKHVNELWDFCKNDEPVELKDWSITDINPDSTDINLSGKMTLINDSGYSIHSFMIFSRNDVRRYGFDGWLKNGQTAEITFTENELLTEKPLYITFYLRYSGEDIRFEQAIPIEELVGKTMHVSIKDSVSEWGNPVKKPILVADESENASGAQRHVKEKSEDTEDFTIPETIERERNIAKNNCIIFNNTSLAMTGVSFFNIDKYKQYVVSEEKILPGEYCVVELPEELINNDGKYSWRLSVYLNDGVGSRYDAQIHTKDQDMYCGALFFAQQKEGTRQTYLEAQ